MPQANKYWTLGEIKTKIKKDLGVEDNIFVTDDATSISELNEYINEAIDECEAEIHSIYEDYFMTRAPLGVIGPNQGLITGQEEYALPVDIYANKVRRIIYRNGARVYTIDRIRDWKKFEEYALLNLNGPLFAEYGYFVIKNDPTISPSSNILLAPTPAETGDFVTVWYLRNARRLNLETDVCDIPEFITFIWQYVKCRIYEKEGNPGYQGAVADRERVRAQMNATLTNMVPDADNIVEPDYSFYRDMN